MNQFKILILDDDKSRLAKFRQGLTGHSVDCFETVPEIIECLCKEKYDIIFLDRNPEHIIIHTFNSGDPWFGAENMLGVLPEAKYVPGVWGHDLGNFIEDLVWKR
jgi:hypothetical protein